MKLHENRAFLSGFSPEIVNSILFSAVFQASQIGNVAIDLGAAVRTGAGVLVVVVVAVDTVPGHRAHLKIFFIAKACK